MKKQVCALGWHEVDEDDLAGPGEGAGALGDYFDFDALTSAEAGEATMTPSSNDDAEGTTGKRQAGPQGSKA